MSSTLRIKIFHSECRVEEDSRKCELNIFLAPDIDSIVSRVNVVHVQLVYDLKYSASHLNQDLFNFNPRFQRNL